MKVVDLVKICSCAMKMLSEYDIRIQDYKYVKLYSDYEEMARSGGKISYAVTMLARKYAISEASVYRILRRFKTTINM